MLRIMCMMSHRTRWKFWQNRLETREWSCSPNLRQKKTRKRSIGGKYSSLTGQERLEGNWWVGSVASGRNAVWAEKWCKSEAAHGGPRGREEESKEQMASPTTRVDSLVVMSTTWRVVKSFLTIKAQKAKIIGKDNEIRAWFLYGRNYFTS